MNEQSYLMVSVIIPTLNDGDLLEKCLLALEKQTYPKEYYEIIVVDNGSSDDVESIVGKFYQAKLCFESEPGSYNARNKGVSIAVGDVLAFTDADCLPQHDWIEIGVNSFASTPNCGIVAGSIEIYFVNPTHPTPTELYESLYAFPQKKYIENEGFGVTANLFTSRYVFDQVGLFDSHLKSGGDYEWGKRVKSSGLDVVYISDLKVSHPARASVAEIRKKIARVSKGHYELTKKKIYSRKKFVVSSLIDFFIPYWPIPTIMLGNSDRTFSEKVKISRIAFLVRWTKGFERLKLLTVREQHLNNRL